MAAGTVVLRDELHPSANMQLQWVSSKFGSRALPLCLMCRSRQGLHALLRRGLLGLRVVPSGSLWQIAPRHRVRGFGQLGSFQCRRHMLLLSAIRMDKHRVADCIEGPQIEQGCTAQQRACVWLKICFERASRCGAGLSASGPGAWVEHLQRTYVDHRWDAAGSCRKLAIMLFRLPTLDA